MKSVFRTSAPATPPRISPHHPTVERSLKRDVTRRASFACSYQRPRTDPSALLPQASAQSREFVPMNQSEVGRLLI
jgi:hypothetical protein